MGSRYDSRTTIFSRDGRLYQVEYAIEAINHAGACIGILAENGVVIAAEKKVTSKLLSNKQSEKLYTVDDHMICAVAGLTADANVLISYMRRVAQHHKLIFQEPQPMESLVSRVSDLKQGYTQFGGSRPFGVSFLYAGWDKHHNFQLYQSDPSGNFGGWKATAIGSNNQNAQNYLNTDYKPGMSIAEAKKLAVNVLYKTMDTAAPSAESLEFTVVTKDKAGKIQHIALSQEEIQGLLDEVAAAQKDDS